MIFVPVFFDEIDSVDVVNRHEHVFILLQKLFVVIVFLNLSKSK